MNFASSKVPAQAKFGTLERLNRNKSAAKLKICHRDAKEDAITARMGVRFLKGRAKLAYTVAQCCLTLAVTMEGVVSEEGPRFCQVQNSE